MYLDLYSNTKGDKYLRSPLTEVNDSAGKVTLPLDSSETKLTNIYYRNQEVSIKIIHVI